jgi:hypothetical protein
LIASGDRYDRRIMRLVSRGGLIATALAIGAIAAPSAQAGLFSNGPDPPGAGQQEAQGFLRIYSHQASTPAVATPNNTTIAHTVSTAKSSEGFDYDDAAIGAGVIAGLVLVGTAGTLAVRRRGQLEHS